MVHTARIVYGVSGEGSGHSSRAREMATHLEQAGHEVRIVSYDRGAHDLAPHFDVFEVEGLHLAAEDNSISVIRTFTENLARLPDGHRRFRALRHELFKGFRPDVVITDFEPTDCLPGDPLRHPADHARQPAPHALHGATPARRGCGRTPPSPRP